jgi:NDP-sugar pyrophosphorylase family protein
MQAVILAGGKGTRLRPFTLKQPKPLLPLLEIPFLVWMVDRCRQVGLTDILISVGHLGEQIESFFQTGEDWGVSIRYIYEATPLDTAGALILAQPYFKQDPLVVFNADILTDLDLQQLLQVHQDTGASLTLTLTRVADITAYGLVELGPSGRVASFREKPSPAEAATLATDTINAGTYVLDPAIFAPYTSGDPLSFERRVFPDVLAAGEWVQGYIHPGYWRDLGTPASYYQGQMDILLGKMASFPLLEIVEEGKGIYRHETAQISPQAQVQGPCYIGSYTQIGSEAILPAGTIVLGHCWINRRLEPGVYAPGTLAV